MSEEEEGPVEVATGFTDQFIDAGVAKLDAVFGAGYAKGNPQALAAYVAASASNFTFLMTAAAALQEDSALDEALTSALEEDFLAPREPKPKRRRR